MLQLPSLFSWYFGCLIVQHLVLFVTALSACFTVISAIIIVASCLVLVTVQIDCFSYLLYGCSGCLFVSSTCYDYYSLLPFSWLVLVPFLHLPVTIHSTFDYYVLWCILYQLIWIVWWIRVVLYFCSSYVLSCIAMLRFPHFSILCLVCLTSSKEYWPRFMGIQVA